MSTNEAHRQTRRAALPAPFSQPCRPTDLEQYRRRAERQHERALASGDVEMESIYAAVVEELRR